MRSQHGDAIRFAIPELRNENRRLGIGHRHAELIVTNYQKAFGSKREKQPLGQGHCYPALMV
jgi:hypothetical protein